VFSVNQEIRNFDLDAATWEEKPRRLKLSADIATTIKHHIPLTSKTRLLDFGCGTGLLSFRLLPHVGSVTGVDSSRGMVDVFKRKAVEMGVSNVDALHLDLTQGTNLNGYYDLIVSNMTLHHVPEIEPLLHTLFSVTAAGGYCCLSDLDLEQGDFHANPHGVFHHGFDRGELRRMLQQVGFSTVKAVDAAQVIKGPRIFNLFMMIAQKQ
jgi:2-polyprenyl-3-methyl-5-hydroxy-6-metoxy-1,4-benzoquinol methylase